MKSVTEPNATATSESPPRAVPAPLRTLTRVDAAPIILVLAVIVSTFAIANPGAFLTVFNLKSIAVAAAPLLVMGIGMTYVIITAGIDLSVGSVLVLAGVVAANVMTAIGGSDGGWWPIIIGVASGVAIGLLVGVINGILVSKANVTPLIVTLGTLGATYGIAEIVTGGVDVSGVPQRLTQQIGFGSLLGVPWVVVAALLLSIVGGLVLAFCRFGAYTYAIGSNQEAARRVGIDVDRHLVKVYAVSGLCAGTAGAMSLAVFSSTTLAGHSLDNLAVITAVILGGTSLFGGIGTIFGTVIGVLIPATLQAGFVIVGLQPFWTQVAVSVVLVAAVYFDQIRRRARARG